MRFDKKTKDRLKKKWWIINDLLEEKISSIWLSDIGMFFFMITLPVSFILKTVQWLMYLIGVLTINMIPTIEGPKQYYNDLEFIDPKNQSSQAVTA